MDRDEIRGHVRSLLDAELEGRSGEVITERDVEDRIRRGQGLGFPPGTRFTPLARETIDRHAATTASAPGTRAAGDGPRETVAVGADHGGFALKMDIYHHLEARGFRVKDCGTDDTDACDYPVFARRVAAEVMAGRASAGIVIDGAGIGSAMTVNKLPGIRAAHCHNVVEARNAREHNHAHVLTLGAGIIGRTLAFAIADAFLATPFGEGRHARRVELIEQPGTVTR